MGENNYDARRNRTEGEALERSALGDRFGHPGVGMEWDQPRLAYTMYPCGPDGIGDFRTVGMRVRKFADMHREFAAAAQRREVKAQTSRKRGASSRRARAISSRRCCGPPRAGRSSRTTPRSIHYNARMVACYDKFAALMRPIERIEVPFGNGKSLPGYLHLAAGAKAGREIPLRHLLDGMDGSKEIMCSMYGDKFLERGIAHFIYDGPGQGECTYRDILVTERNHMDAARAVYDFLSMHPNIDTARSVIWSVSMGSFFGLQAAAALGNKIRGAAVTFVCHEPGLNSLMNRSAPSFKMRFMYMSGHDDEDEFDHFVAKFSLLPIAADLKCPVLIQAGEDDELSPIEFSDELIGKIRSPKKLVIYEGERHAIGGNNLSSSRRELVHHAGRLVSRSRRGKARAERAGFH